MKDGLYFRVYPENRRLRFDVYIWPTLGAMRHHLTKRHKGINYREVHACVVTGTTNGKRTCLLGEIHFAQKHMTDDIVAHEAMHAALEWGRRVGLDVTEIVHSDDEDYRASGAEERLCYAIGAIHSQITDTVKQYQ